MNTHRESSSARIVLALACAFCLGVCASAHAQAQGDVSAESLLGPRVRSLIPRLEALSPDAPRAYFELGEEVAAEAATLAERDLAKRLFTLAFELERIRAESADRTLLSSCCLALAQVVDSDGDRRWLRAVASLVTESLPATRTLQMSDAEPPAALEPGALDAANVFAFLRTGRGSRADRLLLRPGVEQTLMRYERLLSPGLMPGGLSELRLLISQNQTCPLCLLRRYQKDSSGIRLCAQCGGRPGPKLSDAQLALQLRTEAAILSGVQRSWAASAMVDAGAPVRDADPAELAATLAVDVRYALYRDGKWVLAPVTSAAAAKPKRADKPSAEGEPVPAESAPKPTSPAPSRAPSRQAK